MKLLQGYKGNLTVPFSSLPPNQTRGEKGFLSLLFHPTKHGGGKPFLSLLWRKERKGKEIFPFSSILGYQTRP